MNELARPVRRQRGPALKSGEVSEEMSWLISRALMEAYESSRSLLEPVEAFSAVICSDGEPSVQSKSSPTAQAYWSPGKTTDSCPRFPSGMTCERLTARCGAELLTSYLAAFHARTSAQPEKVPESTARARGSGASSPGSFARYDRASSSWKTAQCSLVAGLDAFSETWPRSGSMRSGACYLRPPLAPHICASASGYWPTPNVIGFRSDGELALLARQTTNHAEFVAMSDRAARSKRERAWPTPCVAMVNGSSAGALTRISGKSRSNDRLDYAVEKDGKHGRLNPLWVDWLMGWPIGWDALKPLATARFREWRQQHGDCSPRERG